MKAALIAIGSELLTFGRLDTNSDWLTERLLHSGIAVGTRIVVEDDVRAIAVGVSTALERAALILVSGGLGPTQDDRTREALALAAGVPLERDPEAIEQLRRRFRDKGWRFSEEQARMAARPVGAAWIPNPVGGAPGIEMELGGHRLYALPGVPSELKAMFEQSIEPRIRTGSGDRVLAHRILKVAGRTESAVDRAIADLYAAPGVELTVLARATGIEILLLASAATRQQALARLDELDDEIAGRLGDDLFGRGDDTLQSVVGRQLASTGASLAVAESCTAGLLAATITRVPGSSGWFRGGVIAYDNELKTELAGVPAHTIERWGAVSAEVVRALADGVRRRCAVDLGVGIAGIAGPGGGTPQKPVGLVHLAVCDRAGAAERRYRFSGDRALVRRRAVSAALDLVRRRLGGSA